METEPGFVNWRKRNTPLEKGEVREMAWQAVGHGADAVEYWQWRAALNGQEEYHGVLVGADGEPAPVYAEVAQVGKEFEQAGPALSGTAPKAEVALVNDFDSRWAIDFQRHTQEFNPVAEMVAFYRPLREGAQAVDVVSTDAPLAGYKLVVAPGLNVLPQATAAKLLRYVTEGGHLLLGPRSGMKNEDDGLQPEQQPGPLAAALGARVTQFYALGQPVPVMLGGVAGTASIWAETLATASPETRVLATYGVSNGWLDGQPAAVTRRLGKGSITYLGAMLDDATLGRLEADLLKESGVAPILPGTPSGVEVCVRRGRQDVYILLNHGAGAATIELPASINARSLLSGGAFAGALAGNALTLPPHGVAVLQAAPKSR